MKDSFIFYTDNPISYAHEGRKHETDHVKVVAPGEALYFEAKPLSQMVYKAVMNATKLASQFGNVSKAKELFGFITSDADEPKEEKQETPEEAGQTAEMILMTSEVDNLSAIEHFFELAKSGCVLVNGKRINQLQWQEMSNYDKDKIFYQFVGFFLMSSVFSSPKEKKDSKKLEMK